MEGSTKESTLCVDSVLYFKTVMTENESLLNLSHSDSFMWRGAGWRKKKKKRKAEQRLLFFPVKQQFGTIDVLQDCPTPSRHAHFLHDTHLAAF